MNDRVVAVKPSDRTTAVWSNGATGNVIIAGEIKGADRRDGACGIQHRRSAESSVSQATNAETVFVGGEDASYPVRSPLSRDKGSAS